MSTKPSACETQPENQFDITPDDNNDLTVIPSAIWVGGGGDLNCMMWGDTTAKILKNIPDGTLMRGRFKRIKSTNTTATYLVGQY